MRLYQARICVDFEVVEPLHIGSGLILMRESNGEEFEFRLLQRDAARSVWMPGSSLKGALRDIAKSKLGKSRAEELFGPETDNISEGAHQSHVTVHGAAAPDAAVYQEKRTSIHEGTGAARDTRLFAREMLDMGAIFRVELCIHAADQGGLRSILKDVGQCLATFRCDNGYSLGADKAKGAGRLTISGEPTLREARFTPSGWAESEAQPFGLPRPESTAEIVVPMSCPGPYLVKGGIVEEAVPGDRNGRTRQVQLPERNANEIPRIKGNGVAGALRNRARWLVELDPGLDGFDTVETTNGPDELDVVKRVFGDEGYRGRLKIWTSAIRKEGVSRHPSVRLDPLTQAPYLGSGGDEQAGGALFLIEADYGVTFDLKFDWFRPPKDDERALLDALRKDINRNGLMLGYGTSKGFGWFNCSPTEPNHRFSKFPAEDFPRRLLSSKHLSVEQKENAPDPRVTLPWRSIEIDLERIAFPEDEVAQLQKDKSLHSTRLTNGVSGHIDVSWVFDTPVLIGDGGEIRRPQMVGSTYVLPGSTIRGYMRSVLTSILNGRLPKINDTERSIGEAGDRCGSFPLKSAIDRLNRRGNDQQDNPHNPARNSDFRPDFVETLLGFIQELDDGDELGHDDAHLKSRVAFGFAKCITPARLSHPKMTQLLGPNITSQLYDGIAAKFYPPSHVSTGKQAYDRLPKKPADGDPKLSVLQFLEPAEPTGANRADPQKLVFRGRIGFHNLTLAEFGALVWTLTCDAKPSGRHMLGTGRPFGFGQCYCADFDFHIRPHDGTDSPVLPDELGKQLLATGDDFVPGYLAFIDVLKSMDRYHADLTCGPHGAHEAKLRFNARYGQHIRDRSGLGQDEAGYQTAQQISGVRGGEGARARIDGELQDVRTSNGGRLAALIRRAPGQGQNNQ